MDTKLLYHFCELLRTEILFHICFKRECKPPLSTLHQLLQLSGMCPWKLSNTLSLHWMFLPFLFFFQTLQEKKTNSLGHAQATVTEHAKEYVQQISARNKPSFGQRLSQGISPGPDQPCFHEPISKSYVKNSYWQEL